jgi:hypothetical protein
VKGHFLSIEIGGVSERLEVRCTQCGPSEDSKENNDTDVGAVNSSLGSPEAQSNVLVPSSTTLAHPLRLCRLGLWILEDMRLLLKGTFRLHR